MHQSICHSMNMVYKFDHFFCNDGYRSHNYRNNETNIYFFDIHLSFQSYTISIADKDIQIITILCWEKLWLEGIYVKEIVIVFMAFFILPLNLFESTIVYITIKPFFLLLSDIYRKMSSYSLHSSLQINRP